jgi:SAM-dependent methyltransferase
MPGRSLIGRLRRLPPCRAARSLAARSKRVGLDAGLVRYRTQPWSDDKWNRGYAQGQLDYFAGLDELPRYSMLIGYMLYFGGSPEILDVGCGQGLLRARLDGVRFSRYVGIDPSSAAIEHAQQLSDERTRFVVGDLQTADLGDFDTIVLNEVLSIVSDPAALLDRTVELLRPGGRLLTCNWRHPGDGQLWQMIDDRFEHADLVEVYNPANAIAVRGWRMTCHLRRERVARQGTLRRQGHQPQPTALEGMDHQRERLDRGRAIGGLGREWSVEPVM